MSDTPIQPKRGRGRPRLSEEEKKQRALARKRDPKNPHDLIRPPKRTDLANTGDFEAGDNAKYTGFVLALMKLPKIDLTNPDKVRTRVFEYFALCAEHDMKPGVAAIGLAIGLDRRRLWEIRNGIKNPSIPQETKDIVIEVYDSLEVLWENYMQNGKINPVSGIFLGKNNFGYSDKQEYVVTPNTITPATDPATIEAKYAELPDVDGDSD